MNILLIPIGSAGDVHPYLGIGEELKRRGHHITVFTNEHFKHLSESLGFEFVASSSEEVFKQGVEDPRLWDPNRGFEFVAKNFFIPAISEVYSFLERRFIPGKTIVVGSSFGWGARIAQEKLGVPFISLHLQPAMFPSLYETPVYTQAAWASSLPLPLKKIYFQFVDWMTDSVVGGGINDFRKSKGLKPLRRVIREWTHSPLRVIGLFPDWYGVPQKDWPPEVYLTGFPLYDVDHIQTIPPDVQTFLDSGPAPIIFTAGSAMKHARVMFEVAAQACGKLGCRGLLINAFQDQIPTSLPSGVMATRYAPFSQVFPRASVVVHHGGIGTTAQGLAAGVPQLVTPFAHDQFDNAARIVKLGLGEQIFPKQYQGERVTKVLDRLMKDQELRRRAQAISKRLNGPQAISKTCDLIESIQI